jgi:hypothetical protein
MDLIGSLVKQSIKLKKLTDWETGTPLQQQIKQLRKLLTKAEFTEFGLHHDFGMILKSHKKQDPKAIYRQFAKNVPTFNYNKLYKEWWYKTLEGKEDICWPGRIKYFALSSGTSEASTKHIPITRDIAKANQITSIRQITTLSYYDLPSDFFLKGILMLGGSTNLKYNGIYYEGDLSGIQASMIPFWFRPFYKPGKKIAKEVDWAHKLEEITKKAPDWDIGVIVGVPAWIQIQLEKIIEYHKLNNIHEIWPNFKVFGHGGVSFEPYKKTFEKLLGKPLIYMETYMASEGFIAYQARPDTKGMKLALDNKIFFEFVPFDEANFNADGDMVANPDTYLIDEIDLNRDYALLMSTCAGTWRYLIGDVVRLVNREYSEIIITGRTKHYISLCGEHLSVENMNHAVSLVAEELNVPINEFAVAGVPDGTLFSHKWFIGCENPDVIDKELIFKRIDEHLKVLNDDYRVERNAALKKVYGEVLPLQYFYEFMKLRGKIGAQSKFPRVLKAKQLEDFETFIAAKING